MTQNVSINAGYNNCGNANAVQPEAERTVSAPQVQQTAPPETQLKMEDSKAGKLAKDVFTKVGAYAVIAGGQALAVSTGLVKPVNNPTNLLDKIQNFCAQSGNQVEKTAMSVYNKTMNVIHRKEQVDKIIKQAGLDTSV